MKRHYYFKRSFLILISMLMLSAAAVSNAEEITLTTYYPSPYGVYSEMRLYPKSNPSTAPSCQEGLMFYSDGSNASYSRGLYVCGSGGWQPLGGGFWAANGNNIYNTNLGNVGIGTTSAPAEKLDVAGRAHFSDVIKSGNLSAANNIMSVAGMTDVGGFAVGFANGSGAIIGKNAALSGPGVGILGPGGVPAIGMGGDTAGYGYLEAYLGKDLMLKTATINSVIYMKNSTGNVGIGTTNPLTKLNIITTPSNGVQISDSTGHYISLGGGYAGSYYAGLHIGTTAGPSVGGIGGYIMYNYNSNTLEIPSTYSVGITAIKRAITFTTGTIGESSTPSNLAERMRISSNGNVGIGTWNPVVKLHVMGDMGCQFPGSGVYGDYFYVDQEAGRPVVRITDDGSYYPVLQFGKGSSWMNLEYTGSALQIGGNTGSTVLISSIAVGGAYPGYSASWPYETIGMQPTTNLRVNFGSVQKYVFYNSGYAEAAAGGGWGTASDQRFKENVTELTDTLGALKTIRGVRFHWKTKEFPQKGLPEGTQIGFIAQEVEKEFPELVATDPDGYKSLDYGKLTPVLLEAIKEQQKQIEEQRQLIQHLQLEVDTLKEIVGKGDGHA